MLFTSIVTPARIAFVPVDEPEWALINMIIDILFTIDIFMVFNSAYYDSEFQLIDNRKTISLKYISTWFIVDVISVIPFDLLLNAP